MNITYAILFAFLFTSLQVHAQYFGGGMMAGAGMYGLNPQCLMMGAAGASNEDDEISDLRRDLREMDDDIRTLQREEREARNEAQRFKRRISSSLKSPMASFVQTHAEGKNRCSLYVPGRQRPAGDPDTELATRPPADLGTDVVSYHCADGGRIQRASYLCSERSGFLLHQRVSNSDCREAVESYATKLEEAEGKKAALEAAREQRKQLSRTISDLTRERNRDRAREQREMTEGGVCVGCLAQQSMYVPSRRTDWGGVFANAITGAAAIGLGVYSNNQMARYNSQLGYPTQANASWAMGLPFISNAIYGMLGGGGSGVGGYGCSPGMYGPGMMNPYASLYGNPYAMGMPFGGGAFMPGMGGGPFGMGGMNPMMMGGMGGYGMPGMGGMMNPMMGGMNPMLMAGMNPMMMGGLGGMGGMNPMMMGGLGGMGGMNPMMMAGLGGLGGMGGMMGMPGMGGYGMPGMGGMMNPMMGGMMGMPGMGGMMGMPGIGGMGMDPAMMQMQMQMQQQQYSMQMQQQQMYMQMQMRVQAEQMQRQRSLVGLYSEMSSLQMRIQAVQMGSSLGVGVGYGGYGGVGGNFGAPFGGYGGAGGGGSYIIGGGLGTGTGLGTGGYLGAPGVGGYAPIPQPYPVGYPGGGGLSGQR